MSKSDAFEAAILDLLFLNIAIANLGDAAGLRATSTAGSLYLALHTADPGEAGAAQTTSEVAYTGYGRKAVPRSSGGFTRTNSTIALAADQDFPASGSAGPTATWGSVGIASSGTGMILYRFQLSTPIPCVVPVAPRLTTGTTITED